MGGEKIRVGSYVLSRFEGEEGMRIFVRTVDEARAIKGLLGEQGELERHGGVSDGFFSVRAPEDEIDNMVLPNLEQDYPSRAFTEEGDMECIKNLPDAMTEISSQLQSGSQYLQ